MADNKKIGPSRKQAYARAYLTGKNHYRQFPDSDHMTVRGAAKFGYRKGLKDAHFEAKQRKLLYKNKK
jgi:hypothetical protein